MVRISISNRAFHGDPECRLFGGMSLNFGWSLLLTLQNERLQEERQRRIERGKESRV
jgi:hypothetical protein